MSERIYTYDELKDFSDNEILDILTKSWNINNNELEIWAELPPLSDKGFSFLKGAHLVSTGKKLYYPLKGIEHKSCEFYINPKDVERHSSQETSRFIRCILELSPKSEREKHRNPFELCMKPGTGQKLERLPNEIPQDILFDSIDKKSQFILKSIYDFYLEKVENSIENDIKKNQDKLNKIIFQQSALSEIINNLKDNKNTLEKDVYELNKDKDFRQKEIANLIQMYEKLELDMSNKIKRLQNYVAEKALFLKNFEFIDEDDLDDFLLSKVENKEKFDGIQFNNELHGDYSLAVSYIQSHLLNNDILYPRHIIENYLTLLRTKDLIILAGDSGSGKTNLVKSFAKAVGGKSIIIPVKPNWTSSEDLLGYYNPLEKRYLPTPFLDALIEAQKNPEIPYFICLDEMNLARVEYYFADFLSLLETRDERPEIVLYSEDESSHVLSELRAVVDIIQSAKEKYNKNGVINFIELLKDEELNNELRLAFGFSDKDSLLKYHSEIRRMLSGVISMPSRIKMPDNVFIIGAINIDETTHYLSPKILDRAHIMRFESPLLSDWNEILEEVNDYEFDDVSKPLIFDIEALGKRNNYPKFSQDNSFCELFIELNSEFFHKLGVEFGMRTIRQGLHYLNLFKEVNNDEKIAINNFILHKVLPKFTFDGNKYIGEQTKLELIDRVFIEQIKQQLPDYEKYTKEFSAVQAIVDLVNNARANDGIVNFWA